MHGKLGVKDSVSVVTSEYIDGLIERSGAYYSIWLKHDGSTEAINLPSVSVPRSQIPTLPPTPTNIVRAK